MASKAENSSELNSEPSSSGSSDSSSSSSSSSSDSSDSEDNSHSGSSSSGSGSQSSSEGSSDSDSNSSEEEESSEEDDDADAISIASSASGGSDNAAYTARLRHSHVVIDKNLKRDSVTHTGNNVNYESSSSTASHADSSENLFTSLSRHPSYLSKISLNLTSSARLSEPKLSKALAPDTRPIPTRSTFGSFAKDRKDASVHAELPLASSKKIPSKSEFLFMIFLKD